MASHRIVLLGEGRPAEIPRPGRAAAPFAALACAALLLDALPGLAWEVGPVVAAPFLLAALVRASQERLALARLRATTDRILLRDGHAGSSPLLAWRTAELVSLQARARLADEARRIVAAADPRLLPGSAPVNRGAVRVEAAGLEELAHRLEAPGPVSARGVLLARRLLDDPHSALFEPGGGDALPAELAFVLAELEGLEP